MDVLHKVSLSGLKYHRLNSDLATADLPLSSIVKYQLGCANTQTVCSTFFLIQSDSVSVVELTSLEDVL